MTATVYTAGNLATHQAVTGVVPPQEREVIIRSTWPAVSAFSAAVTGLAAKLIRTIVLAPLGWLMLGPFFVMKISPFVCRRYTLTNQRIKVEKGWKRTVGGEVALKDIDELVLAPDSYSSFYRAGDIDIVSGGQVVLKLTAVSDPETFRRAMLNAVAAWVPGKSATLKM